MKRFLEEGEKSLYQEGEDAGKQLTKEMESFVSDYNMMIRKIGDLSDSVDETYAKKQKTEISFVIILWRKEAGRKLFV